MDDGKQTAPRRRGGQGRPFSKGSDARRNAKGRPTPKQALAAVIRRCADPQELVESMLKIIADKRTAARDRIAAFVALTDRGWARPARETKLDITVAQALPSDWRELPEGARAAYLDSLRLRLALPAGVDNDEGEDDGV